MSASVLYTNFGGMLVHEDRGGVERTYVHDEMGNTSYLLDSSNVTDSYEYTPYGQVTHTGVSVTPFTFIGALGYFATGWSMLTSYVRARWYSRVSGSWGSVDPIWPWQKAYQYVDGNPAMYNDPVGLFTLPPWASNLLRGLKYFFLKDLLKCLASIAHEVGIWVDPFSLAPPISTKISPEGRRRICEDCCKALASIIGALLGGIVGGAIGSLVGAIIGGLLGIIGGMMAGSPIASSAGFLAGMASGAGVGFLVGGAVGSIVGSMVGSSWGDENCPQLCAPKPCKD